MRCHIAIVWSFFELTLFLGVFSIYMEDLPVKVQVHWAHVIRLLQTKPTILLGSSPAMLRGAPLHDQKFQRAKDLGADNVRYAVAGYVNHTYGT